MPGDEAGAASNVTLLDAIQDGTLTHWSNTRLNAFVRSLDQQDPACITFFTYLTKYVEYNRSRYLALKQEVLAIKAEIASRKHEGTNALNTTEFSARQAAPLAPSTTSTPHVATPPAPSADLPSYIAATPRPSSAGPPPSGDGTFVRRMGIAGNNVCYFFEYRRNCFPKSQTFWLLG